MKEQSRRARRMERHHKIAKKPALNLVSLMDIFTILVFFLLVNSSSTQQLPNKKDLTLPVSTSVTSPRDNYLIVATPKKLLVQGKKVYATADIEALQGDIIVPLKAELEFLQENSASVAGSESKQNELTIMADENISYATIKKIIVSCQHAGFTNISFAASQISHASLNKSVKESPKDFDFSKNQAETIEGK